MKLCLQMNFQEWRNQFCICLVCNFYIVWQEYILIFLWYHPHQKTFPSLEWRCAWLLYFSNWLYFSTDDIYHVLGLSHFLVGMPHVLNKSWIRHLIFGPGWIVVDEKLTGGRYWSMSWRIPQWLETAFIWRYQSHFQQNAYESIHLSNGNICPLISNKHSLGTNQFTTGVFVGMKCQMGYQFSVETTSNCTCL